MHVVYKGRIADLADLRDGSVFLADFDGGPIVRAMKAFYVNPSGIYGGKIVTLGPFRDEDGGRPGVYEPHVVRQLAHQALVPIRREERIRFVQQITQTPVQLERGRTDELLDRIRPDEALVHAAPQRAVRQCRRARGAHAAAPR